MEAYPKVIIELKQRLQGDDWLWVLAGLKRDKVVWQSLSDPAFVNDAISQMPADGRGWSPARLAILTFEHSIMLEDLVELPLVALPNDLRKKAIVIYRDWRKGGKFPGLYQSGLLALALREHIRLKKTWAEFTVTLGVLDARWLTPLACLYGMVPDPQDMVLSILSSNNESIAFRLALHAILSNPAPIDEQFKVLDQLVTSLPPTAGKLLLSELDQLSPGLAARLSNQYIRRLPSIDGLLEMEKTRVATPSDLEMVHQIDRIGQLFLHSRILRMAGNPRNETILLDYAQKSARRLQGHISARYAQSLGEFDEDCDSQSHQMALDAFQQSIDLVPDSADYAVMLAGIMAKCSQMDTAFENIKELQANERFAENISLNILILRISEQKSDAEAAHKAALIAYEQAQNGGHLSIDDWRYLANYFLEVGIPQNSSQVARLGLQDHPLDGKLLTLLAESTLAQEDPIQALPYVALALSAANQVTEKDGSVIIRPELLELWILCLEKLGAWDLALAERMQLLGNKDALNLDDLHALSNCALQAGDIDQSIQSSREALELDPDDGEAHGLLAHALLALNKTDSALKHYHLAVSSMPSNEEWWLALAELYRRLDRNREGIDILRAAAQALPDSPAIRLALGEAYLLEKSPTLALASLRYAARLDDSIRASLRLGQALHMLGHLDEARRILQRAYLAATPGIQTGVAFDSLHKITSANHVHYPELACLYAQVLSASGENPSALPVLESAIKAQPDYPKPRLMLAAELLSLGDGQVNFEQGISILSPILENNNSATEVECFEAQALLAEIYEASEKWEQSSNAYKEALDTFSPDKPEWLTRLALGLARVSIQMDKPELALEAVKNAAQVAPGNADVQRSLYVVCRALDLEVEAYQAAKRFYELRSSDLDALTWFVEQAMQMEKTKDGIALGVRQDSIEALKSGLALAPDRANLYLSLGELYLQEDKFVEAQNIFHKLKKLEQFDGVGLDDLFRVAKELRKAGLSELAVDLLERSLDLVDNENDVDKLPEHVMSLHSELASVHREHGNYQSSISVLDDGIRLYPDQAFFHLEKADLFLELDQYEDARESIAVALKIDSQDALSHYQKARVERMIGDMPTAYYHSIQSICHADEVKDARFMRKARLQAAQLAEIVLRPRQAKAYLWDEQTAEVPFEDTLPFNILRLELALEERDLVTASNLIESVVDLAPNDTRTLAAQARMLRLQGDREAGERKLNAVQKSIDYKDPEWKPLKPTAYRSRVACCRSGCRAAWEYGDWENAYYWACLASKYGVDEPLSNFLKTQILTARAETTRRSALFEVQRHTPDEDAFSEYAWNEFQKAIIELEKQVEAIGVLLGEDGESLWGDEAYEALNIWRARGYAAFDPTLENAAALGEVLKRQDFDHASLAALILAYVGAGEPIHAVQMIRAEWPTMIENPLVMSHMAIALSDIDDQQAYDYASSALKLVKEGTCPDCPDEPVLEYLVSRLANQVGDKNVAIKSIEMALSEWPDEARWQAYAASILLEYGAGTPSGTTSEQAGEEAEAKAVRYLEQAAALEPEYAAHHQGLGLLYRQRGDLHRAVTAFEQASKLEPDKPKIWFDLAQTQMSFGDLQAAEVNAARALQQSNNELEILMLNAQISFRINNYEAALRYLKTIVELDENHPQALRMISEVLDRLGRTEEALIALERALPLFEYPMEMQHQQVRLIYRARGYEAAIPLLENLINRYPDEPELKTTQAEWYFQNGEGQKAVDIAKGMLQEDQDKLTKTQQANLFYLIGLQSRQDGQLDQAVHFLSEAVSVSPEHLEALIAIGRTYQSRRELRQAWNVFQRAVELTTSDYRPYYHAGQVLKDLKDYLQAEKMLRQAAQIAPDEILVHRLLGAVTVLNLVHNR